jgi:hypothetical protein
VNANPASAWHDLDQRPPRLRHSTFLVALDFAAGLLWILAELTVRGVQRWSVRHPVTVSFGVGLMLLVITVFAVERWLAVNESKRWRAPALMALDAYVFAADRLARRITDRLFELVRALPNPPRIEPRFEAAVALLLAQTVSDAREGPAGELARFARDETTVMAMTATVTSDMVARHQPFASVIQVIGEQQQRLATLADLLGGMSRMMAGPDYAHDPRWAAEIERDTGTVFAHLNDYLEVLQTMRTQVLEAGYSLRSSLQAPDDEAGE